MVTMLTSVYRGELQALITERRQCSVWDIGCSTTSMLTTACQSEGLGALRINHVNGYDLYREETYPALKTLFQQHMPRRIWFSPPKRSLATMGSLVPCDLAGPPEPGESPTA